MSEENTLFKNIDVSNLLKNSGDNLTSINKLYNIKTEKMAQFNVVYLDSIPKFSGETTELSRFIASCDDLINAFLDKNTPDSYNNKYLIYSILNKLEGNAKVIVNINNIASWNDLKLILIRNFADQRDEACLNRDLTNLKQKANDTPLQFYENCLSLLNIICSYIDLNNQNVNDRNLKRNFYKDMTLKVFLSGLRDPLGTTIRSMKPIDLTQAIQFVREEMSVRLFQNSNSEPPIRNNIQRPLNNQIRFN